MSAGERAADAGHGPSRRTPGGPPDGSGGSPQDGGDGTGGSPVRREGRHGARRGAPPGGHDPRSSATAVRHARPARWSWRRSLVVALVALGLVVAVGVVPGAFERDGVSSPAPTTPAVTVPDPAPAPAIGPGVVRADWDGARTGVFRQTQRAEVEAYQDWLGSPVDLAVDYSANTTWNDISNPLYLLEEWQDADQQLVLGVAMLPDQEGVSIERGAAGEYDQYYRTLAQHMVDHGLQDAVLRIGWEFNLAGSRWASADPAAWIGYFRRIVAAMRSVEGQAFVVDWTLNNGDFNAYDAVDYYPGDDVVDFVGVDAYDVSSREGTYPIPEDCTDACALERQQRAWSDQVFGGARGLEFWSSFAAERGKQLSLPEWGLWDRFDGTGGRDDPYYVQQMADFIADPDNAVGYQAYFEYDGAQGEHRLMVNFPRSRELFLELFGGRGVETR